MTPSLQKSEAIACCASDMQTNPEACKSAHTSDKLHGTCEVFFVKRFRDINNRESFKIAMEQPFRVNYIDVTRTIPCCLHHEASVYVYLIYVYAKDN